MPEITPGDWLQYGALGLLGLGMFFASFIGYRVFSRLLSTLEQVQAALIGVVQNNSAAMAGLQATIGGMQQVMLRCQNVPVEKEEGEEEPG